jgi:hypothetical protein
MQVKRQFEQAGVPFGFGSRIAKINTQDNHPS